MDVGCLECAVWLMGRVVDDFARPCGCRHPPIDGRAYGTPVTQVHGQVQAGGRAAVPREGDGLRRGRPGARRRPVEPRRLAQTVVCGPSGVGGQPARHLGVRRARFPVQPNGLLLEFRRVSARWIAHGPPRVPPLQPSCRNGKRLVNGNGTDSDSPSRPFSCSGSISLLSSGVRLSAARLGSVALVAFARRRRAGLRRSRSAMIPCAGLPLL